LLDMVPNLPPELRRDAARAYLDACGGALTESARAALVSKALAAIDAPELRPLFGPDARSEVALAGFLPRPGRPHLAFSGRLDRLVATDEGVFIVDFKLGEKPDRHAPVHVAQLALYRAALQPLFRGLPIEAALVYLDGPTFTPIGAAELDAALNAIAEVS
jgi:ATP-dependent helicase/nuclease subunit A